MTIKVFPKLSPYKVAILNPYLQNGLTEIAEVEAARRMILAGDRLGLTVKMFARSEELYEYGPDFVIAHSYQDPKLTYFPTYGTLTMPPMWVENIPRFKRNILSYDCYITISETVRNLIDRWVKDKPKQLQHVYAAFSAPYTPFSPQDLSLSHAAYLGTNWDGQRHQDFFQQFAQDNHLTCYGPKVSWQNSISTAMYGGEVPFDGLSVFETYRKSGIGLGINHKSFDKEGIPTSRTFEIPASSAVMISSHNNTVEEIYGDTALYVDTGLPSRELAQNVKHHVEWVRNNPQESLEMARAANQIFNDKLCLEVFLQNLVEHFEKNFKSIKPAKLSKETSVSISPPSIEVILFCNATENKIEDSLLQILKQTLTPKTLNIVHGAGEAISANLKDQIQQLKSRNVSIKTTIQHDCSPLGKIEAIRCIAMNSKADWLAILDPTDKIYPNHFDSCINTYRHHKTIDEPSRDNTFAVFSGIIDRSTDPKTDLPELYEDKYLIKRNERLRLGFFPLSGTPAGKEPGNLGLGSTLLHLPALQAKLDNILSLDQLLTYIENHKSTLFTSSVTYERNISLTEAKQ
ncbi:glycosyltransferase family protein [Kiloniella litopenaei]|uniref:glycosyltransferase family protein n=1 Tax=Kiloniella litopenaei TaxID=1549748 RepID=UPI003BA970A0